MRRSALPLLLLLASACAGPAPAAGPAATDHIDLPKSYLFKPADITVRAGTTVTWTNDDNFTHNIRLKDSGQVLGLLRPGDSLQHLFAAPGTYHYECSLHPQNMQGTITVTGP